MIDKKIQNKLEQIITLAKQKQNLSFCTFVDKID